MSERNKSGTRLTLSNEYGEFSVWIGDSDMNLPDVMERLVDPVLLAAGYSQETIIEVMQDRLAIHDGEYQKIA